MLAAATVQAKLNVVRNAGGFRVYRRTKSAGTKWKVTNLARGTEDPHFVDARPSHINTLNKADVLLEGGLELEIAGCPLS